MVLLTEITQSRSKSKNNKRKRSNTENFDVLLSIYKMNPLKHSNVYKMFSNRVLLPRPDVHNADLNYNSNESTKKANDTNVKMETTEKTFQTAIYRPLYVDNKMEKFDPEYFIKTIISESYNRTNSDEAEILINRVYHRKEKIGSKTNSNGFNNTERPEKISEGKTHLKVFNLNNIGDNKIDFNDADVVVVK
ncbi:unnamed protein product [Euphydryas editha]|uniref:Uncharacterized protein n=1 Tax=Euphydryas editha TaxID=104508 RepID=A0AAU9UBA2_EUPED|nr:unnamed protein product [Euphydryas editha]